MMSLKNYCMLFYSVVLLQEEEDQEFKKPAKVNACTLHYSNVWKTQINSKADANNKKLDCLWAEENKPQCRHVLVSKHTHGKLRYSCMCMCLPMNSQTTSFKIKTCKKRKINGATTFPISFVFAVYKNGRTSMLGNTCGSSCDSVWNIRGKSLNDWICSRFQCWVTAMVALLSMINYCENSELIDFHEIHANQTLVYNQIRFGTQVKGRLISDRILTSSSLVESLALLLSFFLPLYNHFLFVAFHFYWL